MVIGSQNSGNTLGSPPLHFGLHVSTGQYLTKSLNKIGPQGQGLYVLICENVSLGDNPLNRYKIALTILRSITSKPHDIVSDIERCSSSASSSASEWS